MTTFLKTALQKSTSFVGYLCRLTSHLSSIDFLIRVLLCENTLRPYNYKHIMISCISKLAGWVKTFSTVYGQNTCTHRDNFLIFSPPLHQKPKPRPFTLHTALRLDERVLFSATAAIRSEAPGDGRERFALWMNALSVSCMREESEFPGTGYWLRR